ncbi:hypothetical protein [Nitrosomonas ureae]
MWQLLEADKLKGSKGTDRIVAGDGDDTLIGRGGAEVKSAGFNGIQN